MPRTNLDTGLQELQRQMKKLDVHVNDMLAKTLKVLETGDHLALHQVIESTIPLNAFSTAAEQQALRLLILQQPLGGQDLRLLTAALHISEALRQIGNASSELAQTLLQAATLYQQANKPDMYSVSASPLDQHNHFTDAFLLRGLLLLGEEIQYILHRAMETFTTLNAESARTIITEQHLVEIRYAPLCQDIMSMQTQHAVSCESQQDSTFLQRITYLLWMAHKLAEIATHVGTICKRVIFIVEGWLLVIIP